MCGAGPFFVPEEVPGKSGASRTSLAFREPLKKLKPSSEVSPKISKRTFFTK